MSSSGKESTVEKGFSAPPIEVLEGLEPVRRRPAMYVGDLHDGTGQHHLIWEIVGNAIDEHLVGLASRVHVQVDGTRVVVDDDGRGLKPQRFEELFLSLHSGSTGDGHFPHVHVGWRLHGVGLGAVNACCERLVVESHWNGERFRCAFEKGVLVEPVTSLGGTCRTGTRISFQPDFELFAPKPFDAEAIQARLWELACLNPGLETSFNGERSVAVRGSAEAVRKLGAEPSLIAYGTTRWVNVDVALGWGGEATADVRGFVSQFRVDEGSHVDGLWRALRDCAPDGVNPAALREQFERGLIAWISVGLDHPKFGGPSRQRLAHRDVFHAVREVIRPQLQLWCKRNVPGR